jgi:hypothetical protein
VVRLYRRRFKDIVVENVKRLRNNGVDFFRGECARVRVSTEGYYALLVVDHRKLIPNQGIPIPWMMNPLK